MTEHGKRAAGIWLIVLAVILAIAAAVLWSDASDEAAADQLANEYAEALGGEPASEVEPDRAPALAGGGVAAVLFLGGVILLAGSRPDDDA